MSAYPPESATLQRLANLGRPCAPPLPIADGIPKRVRALEVFGIGTDWVQLHWQALGPGPVRFRAGDTTVEVHADGGPGAVTLGGLDSAHGYSVLVDGDGMADGPVVVETTTLRPPPGEELFRIGTVSDVHIGQTSAGFLHTIVEIPEPVEAHPVRCLRAALADIVDWGARRLVVKGDLTHESSVELWDQVGALLDGIRVPVDVVPGNHEGRPGSTIDAREGLAPHGYRLVRGVQITDLPGIRLVVGDSTIPGVDWGQISGIGPRIVRAAQRAGGGVLVGIHHHPMRFRLPTSLPPGIPGPEARPFLADLARANPATFVTTGHTHRHRRHRHGPLVVTEVGATVDFPGTWAGYQIYESGIVQTVRRVSEPSCIRWTDYTRKAALGLWQYWSPGRLSDRCFTHRWP